MSVDNPQFPQYPPPVPNPKGIPVADPKQGKPLWKMVNLMLRPKTKPFKTVTRSPKKKKDQVKFY